MPYKKIINQYLTKHGFEAFVPKAVLFDMDGVLYNSMPNHAVAWQESMKQFGIQMSVHDAYATEGARGIDTIRNMVKVALISTRHRLLLILSYQIISRQRRVVM